MWAGFGFLLCIILGAGGHYLVGFQEIQRLLISICVVNHGWVTGGQPSFNYVNEKPIILNQNAGLFCYGSCSFLITYKCMLIMWYSPSIIQLDTFRTLDFTLTDYKSNHVIGQQCLVWEYFLFSMFLKLSWLIFSKRWACKWILSRTLDGFASWPPFYLS